MKFILRITRDLLREIEIDLARPHAHAFERVGFIYCRPGMLERGHLLLSTGYMPIRDEYYLTTQDEIAAAIINRYAITAAMQRSLNTGEGVFHIHMHEGGAYNTFSEVDRRSLTELMPCFYRINPSVPHGAVLLTTQGITGCLWTKNGEFHPLTAISIVGYPCIHYEVRAE